MISFNDKEPVWVEKYRPQTIEDCILPDSIKNQFKNILKSGHIPTMLLTGGPGTGKTTIAKAMCKEMGVDWIIINASDENGIETIRTKIKDFASTISLSNKGKCVILDEADNLTPAAQSAFRGAIEAFSRNCSFIFTCNFPNRIIEPIHSRSIKIVFEIKKDEAVKLQVEFFKRISEILDNEKIEYDKKSVITLIQKFFPDNRKILDQIQHFSKAGIIGPEILINLSDTNVENLIKAIKSKKFKDVGQWCADNKDNDLSSLYSKLYKMMKDQIIPDSIPEMILTIEDYQRYDSIVPDKEIHLTALCVTLMMQVSFK